MSAQISLIPSLASVYCKKEKIILQQMLKAVHFGFSTKVTYSEEKAKPMRRQCWIMNKEWRMLNNEQGMENVEQGSRNDECWTRIKEWRMLNKDQGMENVE